MGGQILQTNQLKINKEKSFFQMMNDLKYEMTKQRKTIEEVDDG